MKLTKRKALEMCRDLWRWLGKTGRSSKRGWPGWKRYKAMLGDCPCCEYSFQHKGRYCTTNCIIKWPGGNCGSYESPFNRWDSCPSVFTRIAMANTIVGLAKNALKRLPKANKKTHK